MPTSKNYLLVTGLLATTGYQFSVLPQNKLGSGPFSEIITVRTQGLYNWTYALGLITSYTFYYKYLQVLTYTLLSYQLCQQKHLQLSPLSQFWILPYSCQPTGPSKAFCCGGFLPKLHFLHWQVMYCRPAGIRGSGSSSPATSAPIRVTCLFRDCWG